MWFFLFIPCVVLLILLWQFRDKTVWWEFLIPIPLSVIIIAAWFYGSTHAITQKNEYWGGWLTKVKYYEDWNEYVTYTVVVTDSKGNTRTETRSRIDYHPEYWTAEDSNGASWNVNKETYNKFQRKWNNQQFKELYRNSYSNDGDLYYSTFDNVRDHKEITNSLHRYENRVAASRSVFNFKPVDKKTKTDFGLYDYPKIVNYWETQSILGPVVSGFYPASKELSFFNGEYGAQKEVRVWLLLFQNQPLEAGFEQQNYWKNGNMNELVVCIGLDNKENVTWSHVFSWCDKSEINVTCRDYFADKIGKPVNLVKVVEDITTETKDKWERKDFAVDFKYISVDPPFWSYIGCIITLLAANFGMFYWIVNNDIRERLSKWEWNLK